MNTTDVILIVIFIIFVIVILFYGSTSFFSGGARKRERRLFTIGPYKKWLTKKELEYEETDVGWKDHEGIHIGMNPSELRWDEHRGRYVEYRDFSDKSEWGSAERIDPRRIVGRTPQITKGERRSSARTFRLPEDRLHLSREAGEHPIIIALKNPQFPQEDKEVRDKIRDFIEKYELSRAMHEGEPWDWEKEMEEKGLTADMLVDLLRVNFNEDDLVVRSDYDLILGVCSQIEELRQTGKMLGMERLTLPEIYFGVNKSLEIKYFINWVVWRQSEEFKYGVEDMVIALISSDNFKRLLGYYISKTIGLETFGKNNIDFNYSINIEIRPNRLTAAVTDVVFHTDQHRRESRSGTNIQIDTPDNIGAESIMFILLDSLVPPAILKGYPNYLGPFDQLPRELRMKVIETYKEILSQMIPGKCSSIFLNNKTIQHQTPDALLREIIQRSGKLSAKLQHAKGITRFMFLSEKRGLILGTPYDGIILSTKAEDILKERVKYGVLNSDMIISEQRRTPKYKSGETVFIDDRPYQIMGVSVPMDDTSIRYKLFNNLDGWFVEEAISLSSVLSDADNYVIFPLQNITIHDKRNNIVGKTRMLRYDGIVVHILNRPQYHLIPYKFLGMGHPEGREEDIVSKIESYVGNDVDIVFNYSHGSQIMVGRIYTLAVDDDIGYDFYEKGDPEDYDYWPKVLHLDPGKISEVAHKISILGDPVNKDELIISSSGGIPLPGYIVKLPMSQTHYEVIYVDTEYNKAILLDRSTMMGREAVLDSLEIIDKSRKDIRKLVPKPMHNLGDIILTREGPEGMVEAILPRNIYRIDGGYEVGESSIVKSIPRVEALIRIR